MVILAFISDIDVVRKILDHLRIPSHVVPPPLPRGPQPRQPPLSGLSEAHYLDFDDLAQAPASDDQWPPSSWAARGPPHG